MRGWLLAGIALWLTACAPAAEKEDATPVVETASAAGCNLTASAAIALTGASAADMIEARAFGPTCAQATLVFTVRDSTGAVIHADAMAASDSIPPTATAPLDTSGVQSFIDAWARPEVVNASTAPAWAEGAARPGGDGDPLILTDMIRPMYEDVRKQNLKLICYLSGASEKTCLYAKSTGGVVEIMYRMRA
jgi:hypothetical protein